MVPLTSATIKEKKERPFLEPAFSEADVDSMAVKRERETGNVTHSANSSVAYMN